MSNEYHTYLVTHKAWFLICPVNVADFESEAPVPIPRGVPDWWFDFNAWLYDYVNLTIWLFAPERVGYVFYNVLEYEKPFEIKVKAE